MLVENHQGAAMAAIMLLLCQGQENEEMAKAFLALGLSILFFCLAPAKAQ
jgi:hypothetical protein